MNTPIHQKLYFWIYACILGFTAFGTVIGAINDANSIINAQTTYLGTFFILGMWISVELVIRNKAIRWVSEDNREVRIKAITQNTRLALVGMILLLWTPRLPDAVEKMQEFLKNYQRVSSIPELRIYISNNTDDEIELNRFGKFTLINHNTSLSDPVLASGKLEIPRPPDINTFTHNNNDIGPFRITVDGITNTNYVEIPIRGYIEKEAVFIYPKKLHDVLVRYLDNDDITLDIMFTLKDGTVLTKTNVDFSFNHLEYYYTANFQLH